MTDISRFKNSNSPAPDAPVGADVGNLLSQLPGASGKYEETGRQAAAQVALGRWPLLLEIQRAVAVKR